MRDTDGSAGGTGLSDGSSGWQQADMQVKGEVLNSVPFLIGQLGA